MMTKKKIVAIILTALLAVSTFAGCSTAQNITPDSPVSVSENTEYRLGNVSFKFFEKGFENYAKDNNQVAFRKSDSKGEIKEGVTVVVFSTELKDIADKEIQKKVVDELNQNSGEPGASELISSKEETVGDVKGFKVDLKSISEGQDAFMNIFLFNYADGIMAITYASKDKNAEQIDTELNKIIDSMRFTKVE